MRKRQAIFLQSLLKTAIYKRLNYDLEPKQKMPRNGALKNQTGKPNFYASLKSQVTVCTNVIMLRLAILSQYNLARYDQINSR